ncbi:tRNA threonylcarbamoyl adenosine modification protein, Sua5/YciO/YrdC/YwlC family [Mariprofundus ferrinatatus]|uniref:tRNA threonylcarbamoyl adenosine modification protein, Sua5/YciO/YrdC/YwlC family n=1 Tax=Mariprofundus ferrinatatus TaxID=1921087 RepID=A0A2K8L5Q6_9PROT|nr:L-threonylcarbamoyladenylate synthase [Mariprofundus ferrinatatus]ATX82442.1 tRNA threonylcarbamoyl adenosine modification protein, Sua5/YciO/YrdC/YwlC family [Mariprofundus ferrinatatus]
MHLFEHLRLHPERPQIRQIRRAVELLRQGLFVAVPTETTYVLLCLPESGKAVANITRLRQLDSSHMWSVVCADLSQAATCVRMDNHAHRILKRCLPGPYTFILPASSSLPKRIFGKRRDVGIRIPAHPVCQMLLDEIGEVLLATTLQLPGSAEPEYDPDEFVLRIKHLSCAIMDAGWCGMVPTTVVDLCGDEPELHRQGAGEWPA